MVRNHVRSQQVRPFLQLIVSLVSWLVACGCLSGCSKKEAASHDSGREESVGSLSLRLTLSNGAELTEVGALLESEALTAPIERVIQVAGEGTTISALFGGLPGGEYSLGLQATSADGLTHCSGSATFSIIAGSQVGVTIPLSCVSAVVRGEVQVQGSLNLCPIVTSIFVAPLQVAYQGEITVVGSAGDPDGDQVTFQWSASGGQFQDAQAGETLYTCVEPGEQELTFQVSDGVDCEVEYTVPVLCGGRDGCGDGVIDVGEECDPPVPGICSDICQDVSPMCGDGVTNSGLEECDPPNGSTCNSNCELIECGDGAIEGQETCEPPGTPFCDAQCHSIPGCGNGIIDEGEACDPPEAGICDESCQVVNTNACGPCLQEFCPAPIADLEARCIDDVCDSLVACYEETGCAGWDDPDVRKCYCGTMPFTECFNAFAPNQSNGPCKQEVEELAGTNVPIQVGTLFFDNDGPLGAVNQVQLCAANNCSVGCYSSGCSPFGCPLCGNGVVEHGEECDPPDGILCDFACRNIELVCGNGYVQTGEQCDPPNGVTCDEDCEDIPIVCGNGILQPGEFCEPPGTPLCDDFCQENIVCGNGVIQTGEECDPPEPGVCEADCRFAPFCGDGELDSQLNEQCDPPDGITCDSECQDIPIECGNGIVQPGEQCDPPLPGLCEEDCTAAPGSCLECTSQFCGGPLQAIDLQCAGGVCDEYVACLETTKCAQTDIRNCYCGDTEFTTCFNSFSTVTGNGPCLEETQALVGSTVPLLIGARYFDIGVPLGAVNQLNLCGASECSQCGSICSMWAGCNSECGNGTLEPELGEQCDPPNGVDCSSSCLTITIECGNGIVQPGEQCDPPNGITCDAECQDIPVECGDGIVQPGEECDPPVAGACTLDCQALPYCGNGGIDFTHGEECDPPDGVTCDEFCQSIPRCGDGEVQPSLDEQCDPPEDDVCDEQCQFYPAECGDGVIQGSENCDSSGSRFCADDCTLLDCAQTSCGQNCPAPLAAVGTQCAGGICDELIACQVASDCADTDVRDCYCGDTEYTACFNSFSTVTGNGPCLQEIEQLAGATVPLQIGTLYFDITVPLGAVNQLALCSGDACLRACVP